MKDIDMKSLYRLSLILLAVGALLVETPSLPAFEHLFEHFGTGTYLHPIEKPDAVCYPSCCEHKTCCCCKEHVYIFCINGVNPMCLGNFNGMCDYLREQGFENTYFAQLYTCQGYAARIREIRASDPCARIVVLGFSAGCNFARCLANMLARDCTRVDLLVYLAGDMIDNSPRSFPENVCRVLNIRAQGLILAGGDLIFCGADIDGACNYKLDCRHILVPSRRETLELLMTQLLALCCGPSEAPPAQIVPDAAPAQPAPQAK
jgi:hypothetical protein